MRTLTILLLVLPLAGCPAKNTRPEIPEAVKVVVEKPAKLPSWATEPLPKPEPADGTVGARVTSHQARGDVIDLANCHRRLLRRIEKGEMVEVGECEQ